MSPGRPGDAHRLLAFYLGRGTDDAGRSFADILNLDDAALEHHHDYIQWLFPLRVPSSFHPEAPVLDDTVVEAFHRDPELRERLVAALDRMLTFYGLELRAAADGSLDIEPAATFSERSANWLRPHNHNHLRLTRILSCLCILGLADHARALEACLARIAGQNPGTVTAETLRYWRNALSER